MKKERFKLTPAVYLLLRKDDQVLLLRRANTGYADGKYSLVAGHLDGGELATDALAREAREEAGIQVSPKDMTFVHVAHRLEGGNGSERVDLFFEAWRWTGEIRNMEPAKCDDLSWFPIDQLPKDTLLFIGLVIEKILRNEPYSEYSKEQI
jgi:8-oxo-dGTP pyrophosphatase MutT (NUDIX family)